MKATIHIPEWATFILSDHTDMDRNPQNVDATKVSKFSLTLPDDVYFEYAFIDESGELRPDPLNELKADNPWFPDMSALLGPTYQAAPLATPSQEAAGTLKRVRIVSNHLAQTRRLISYTPLGYEAEPLPVIYIQDGVAYYRIAKLAEVLETLLIEKAIRPAHLVFIEPIDRTVEYSYNPAYQAFMIEEVIPYFSQELQVTNERMLMGASLGGLVSATLALKYSELFSTLVTQSGAFLGHPENKDFYRAEESWVLSQVQRSDALNFRWYLDTGTLEWLVDINRNIAALLEAKGYDFFYAERHAGHNWVNWRNGVGNALRYALKL